MASSANAQLAKLAISIVSVAAIAGITGRIAGGQEESAPAGEPPQQGDAVQAYTPAPAAGGGVGLLPSWEESGRDHDDDDEDEWEDEDYWEDEDDDDDHRQVFLEPRSAFSGESVVGGQGSPTQRKRTRSRRS